MSQKGYPTPCHPLSPPSPVHSPSTPCPPSSESFTAQRPTETKPTDTTCLYLSPELLDLPQVPLPVPHAPTPLPRRCRAVPKAACAVPLAGEPGAG